MAKGHDPASDSSGAASGATRVASATPASGATNDAGAAPRTADPLSDVLSVVRLTGALFFEACASSPWVAEVPESPLFAPLLLRRAQRVVSYHIVTRGACWGQPAGGPAVRLEAGDAVLFSGGQGYVMSSHSGMRSRQPLGATLAGFRELAARQPPVVELGSGGGGDCRIVCGYLGCDVRPFNPVIAALPAVVHVRPPSDGADDRVRLLASFALTESHAGRAGGRCVLLRLSELMFIEVIRRHLAELPAEQPGWLAGLCDPVVGGALALLHGQPAEPWTLERLAREVCVSRSTMADRFVHFVGQPPMHYLTRWRMQLATKLLAEGDAKVRAVAAQVGYESEEAFSRAFKRLLGAPPSVWRRRAG